MQLVGNCPVIRTRLLSCGGNFKIEYDMSSFYQSLFLKTVLLVLILSPDKSYGEYRVYQYLIHNKEGQEQKPLIEQSTLDPIGFQAYHGGSRYIDFTLLRTWICRGNTSYIRTCTPPLKPFEQIGKIL